MVYPLVKGNGARSEPERALRTKDVSKETTRSELDLGHQAPTGRADVHFQPEEIQAEGSTGKLRFKLMAKIFAGSSQSTALATLELAGASCLITGVAAAIGVSALTALIAGLGATAGFCLLIYFTRERRGRSRSGQG